MVLSIVVTKEEKTYCLTDAFKCSYFALITQANLYINESYTKNSGNILHFLLVTGTCRRQNDWKMKEDRLADYSRILLLY